MAIDKLFQVLVVGGVTLGTQACAKKSNPPQIEPPITPENMGTTVEASEEVERIPERPGDSSRMLVNSKGEKCEDICSGDEGREMICSDMCCWLMAIECCPNYSPPPEE